MMEIKIMQGNGIPLRKTITTNWFMRMFYVMAAVPVALIVEVVAESSITASAASAVLMVSIMAAILTYCWAMFKSFHSGVYSQADGLCALERSSCRFVVAKLASAAAWFIVLFLAVAVVLFMHITILERMPEAAAKSDLAQLVMTSINDSFGRGVFRVFSAASLLFQAVVLVSITYAAAVVSHLKVFERYKALAGIFVFVLFYFFENDFAGTLKRMIARGFGGIEELMSINVKGAVGILTGIEFFVYLAITAINIAITCYFLKKLKEGERNG